MCLVRTCIFSGRFSVDTTVGSANDQHHLADDIDVDPQKTGVSVSSLAYLTCICAWQFFRAMRHCEFLLLVLDKNSTPMTRVWWFVLLALLNMV